MLKVSEIRGTAKFLKIEKSRSNEGGPIMEFRPALPKSCAQVLVTDVTNAANTAATAAATTSGTSAQIAEFGQTALRWAATVQQYAQEVASYEQVLIRVANLEGMGVASINNQLQPISDASTFVQNACPGSQNMVSSAMSMVGLSSMLNSDPSANIAVTQQQICQQITLRQIDKYNITVGMLNRLNDYSGLLSQIEQLRNDLSVLSGVGDLNSNTNQVLRTSNQLTTEMSNWKANLDADDAVISALQQQQSVFAKLALNGKPPGLLGGVVQGAIFVAAFQ